MPKISDVITYYKNLGRTVILSESNADSTVSKPRNLEEAESHNLTFAGTKYASNLIEALRSSASPIIIVDESLLKIPKELESFEDKSFILSPNPKADLITYCQVYLGFQSAPEKEHKHPSANISSQSQIGQNVHIGPGVVIEDDVTIGDYSRIGANTVIKQGTRIGEKVEIGSCNVIGGTGFGYSKPEGSNEYEQFPHYGNVIIKDRVHIGNNTCIDRGSLSDTVLEEAVKVDNLVHIAHNVKIGKNSLIIACTMIAGSVEIGEDTWVAPSSTIINGIQIGDRATIGLASTVTKHVDNDLIVTGSPAMDIQDFRKIRAHQKQIIQQSGDS